MNVLVNGWYGRGNAGDELMAQALRSLFEPRGVNLKFVDFIDDTLLDECDGVIFGGGCILQDAPNVNDVTFETLTSCRKPCFYVGIGTETSVHESHRSLINVAQMIITRSSIDQRPDWFPCDHRVSWVEDLVHSLRPFQGKVGSRNEILVIPNVEVLPTWQEPHWKHVAWERYKDEFAQFLDCTIEERGMKPAFMLMCNNEKMSDDWVMHEIVGRMKNRSTKFETYHLQGGQCNATYATGVIKEHKHVITQRYHGIILAQMTETPFTTVHHHDKLKHCFPNRGQSVPYYGFSKALMIEAIERSRVPVQFNVEEISKRVRDIYDRLVEDIVGIILKQKGTHA